jgi:hypothetical protein
MGGCLSLVINIIAILAVASILMLQRSVVRSLFEVDGQWLTFHEASRESVCDLPTIHWFPSFLHGIFIGISGKLGEDSMGKESSPLESISYEPPTFHEFSFPRLVVSWKGNQILNISSAWLSLDFYY